MVTYAHHIRKLSGNRLDLIKELVPLEKVIEKQTAIDVIHYTYVLSYNNIYLISITYNVHVCLNLHRNLVATYIVL